MHNIYHFFLSSFYLIFWICSIIPFLYLWIHYTVINIFSDFFAQCKKYMIWRISFSKFPDVLPVFTCSNAIGNLWSICLSVNIFIILPCISFLIGTSDRVDVLHDIFSWSLSPTAVIGNILPLAYIPYIRQLFNLGSIIYS